MMKIIEYIGKMPCKDLSKILQCSKRFDKDFTRILELQSNQMFFFLFIGTLQCCSAIFQCWLTVCWKQLATFNINFLD